MKQVYVYELHKTKKFRWSLSTVWKMNDRNFDIYDGHKYC